MSGATNLGNFQRSIKRSYVEMRDEEHTVSATLTVSFLSFNKLATSPTTALTFSGGNSLAADILVTNLLLIG
jgi:hypothetical protein